MSQSRVRKNPTGAFVPEPGQIVYLYGFKYKVLTVTVTEGHVSFEAKTLDPELENTGYARCSFGHNIGVYTY